MPAATSSVPTDPPHPESHKSKKKKRKHSEQHIDAPPQESDVTRKRKKKKKSSETVDEGMEELSFLSSLPINTETGSSNPTAQVPDVMLSPMQPSTMADFHLDLHASNAILSAIAASGPDLQTQVDYQQAPFPFFPSPDALTNDMMNFDQDSQAGSNDLVRALQGLDVTKLASVLKTLEEAAAAANVPFELPRQVQLPPDVTNAPPPPVKQLPASSADILNMKGSSAGTDKLNATGGWYTSQDHASLLATKWMDAKKLADLTKSDGLVYKKGKFSAVEERQLKNAIDTYCTTRQLSEEGLQAIIFPKNDRDRDNAFWQEITSAVPQRPLIAVYHHVRRAYHPMKQQGKWQPDEDARLKQAVADLGQQWEKISQIVGRRSGDCRDRWRNHITTKDLRSYGPWSKDEEDELTKIVTRMIAKKEQNGDTESEIFWGTVSQQMGGKRTRQQCRIKWTDCLANQVKNDGEKTRWSSQDAYILVHKIDSLKVRDDSEIDWKLISDENWDLFSPHVIQRRWLTMKRGIKGYEDLAHQEIVDILKEKKANVTPSASTRRRRERRVNSAAAIPDGEGSALGSTPS